MTVGDVSAALETLAPPALAEDWDAIGLSVGKPQADVDRVLVALTVTRAAFRAAQTARAQMIVSHHPLIWTPLKALRTDDPAARLCLDIAAANVSCYAAHTNLDAAPGGVNDAIADKLGAKKRSPLFTSKGPGFVKLVTFVPESHVARVRDAVCGAGAGVMGAYTHCTFTTPGTGTFLPADDARPFSGEPGKVNQEQELRFEVLTPRHQTETVVAALERAHPYEEVAYDLVPLENRDATGGLGIRGELEKPVRLDAFAKRLKEVFRLSYVRVKGDGRRRVRSIGILGGSGGKRVGGVPEDIDVYLTGDVGYHDALAAEGQGLALIDAGHAGLEKAVVPVVARYLKKTLPGLRVSTFSENEPFRAI